MHRPLECTNLEPLSPKLAEITESLLFGDIWQRAVLTPRERSLITLACLMALGRDKQLAWHIRFAQENGLNAEELNELFTHLAFYAGWPAAVCALQTLAEEKQACR